MLIKQKMIIKQFIEKILHYLSQMFLCIMILKLLFKKIIFNTSNLIG